MTQIEDILHTLTLKEKLYVKKKLRQRLKKLGKNLELSRPSLLEVPLKLQQDMYTLQHNCPIPGFRLNSFPFTGITTVQGRPQIKHLGTESNMGSSFDAPGLSCVVNEKSSCHFKRFSIRQRGGMAEPLNDEPNAGALLGEILNDIRDNIHGEATLVDGNIAETLGQFEEWITGEAQEETEEETLERFEEDKDALLTEIDRVLRANRRFRRDAEEFLNRREAELVAQITELFNNDRAFLREREERHQDNIRQWLQTADDWYEGRETELQNNIRQRQELEQENARRAEALQLQQHEQENARRAAEVQRQQREHENARRAGKRCAQPPQKVQGEQLTRVQKVQDVAGARTRVKKVPDPRGRERVCKTRNLPQPGRRVPLDSPRQVPGRGVRSPLAVAGGSNAPQYVVPPPLSPNTSIEEEDDDDDDGDYDQALRGRCMPPLKIQQPQRRLSNEQAVAKAPTRQGRGTCVRKAVGATAKVTVGRHKVVPERGERRPPCKTKSTAAPCKRVQR